MAKSKTKPKKGVGAMAVTIGELHELHTAITNLHFKAAMARDAETARLLQALMEPLSAELLRLNDAAIKKNAKTYRGIAASFAQAKAAADEARDDLKKTATVIATVADLVAKLAKAAVAVV